MTSRRILPTLAVLGLILSGCGRSPSLDVQTFNLQHRSGQDAAALIDPYVFGDREVNPGQVSVTVDAITVRETRDNLQKIARVLEEFDQPIPGVHLFFQLIEADSFQGEDDAIAGVVAELRSLFRFEGYRLVGEAMVPVSGPSPYGTNFTQRFTGMGTDTPMTVQARVRVLPSGSVRLETVSLSDFWDELLSTSVNVAPGQTLVIGGTQATREDRTFILTVRAEID